jgi:CRISPR/Cas system-associated protein Csm6
MSKTYKSKFDGEQLWGFILAHVASPALAQVPTMFRAAARTATDRKFAALEPALRNALDLCASHISAQVVRDFLAQVGDLRAMNAEAAAAFGPTGASSVNHPGRKYGGGAAENFPESERPI